MMQLEYKFTAVIACIILACHGSNAGDTGWDYMKFTQEWPPSVCVEGLLKTHMVGHSCIIGSTVSTWTIHGLWPTKAHTLGPNFCNSSYPYNATAINSLRPQLVKYWPNLFADTKPDDFWVHEWTKHGTCAMTLPELNSEYNYFNKVLQLNQQYSLLNTFEKNGITPSETKGYNFTQFEDALKLYFSPPISCTYVKETKKQYVTQISICLDKNFGPIDCGKEKRSFKEPSTAISSGLQSCVHSKPVYYPVFHALHKADDTLYFKPNNAQ